MPDRVDGHYRQASVVPRPSELTRGLVAASTWSGSGHGWGYFEPDPRYLAFSDRTLPDYKGTGGPFCPARVSLFSVRSRLRFFKNRAS